MLKKCCVFWVCLHSILQWILKLPQEVWTSDTTEQADRSMPNGAQALYHNQQFFTALPVPVTHLHNYNPNCTPYAPTCSVILLQIICRFSRFNGIPGHVDDCKSIHKMSAERRIYVAHGETAEALPRVCPFGYVTHNNVLPVKGIFTCRTQYNMMWSTHCHFQITRSVGNMYAGDKQHRVQQIPRDPSLDSAQGADKSLAWPTSRRILFDGENISFDASLVIYINSTNIPQIMIINRIYEHQNLLSL